MKGGIRKKISNFHFFTKKNKKVFVNFWKLDKKNRTPNTPPPITNQKITKCPNLTFQNCYKT